MSLLSRRVRMFRLVKDGMIGPKPRQAYMPGEYRWDAHINEFGGITVKTDTQREFYVPVGMIEMTELEPLTAQQQAIADMPTPLRIEPLDHHPEPPEHIKRRPGRPMGS